MKTSILSRIIFICSLCIAVNNAKGQYASIPDSNFGIWLYSNGFAAQMTGNSISGWQLDTTSNQVLTALAISCPTFHIRDLTGIQYFKRLSVLDCSYNLLTTLSALPSTIRNIHCENNYLLTSFSSLPDSLTYLEGYSCALTSLPTLPGKLTYLNCRSSQLSSLPPLPASLINLDCGINLLTVLPSLPNALTSLRCDANQLIALPSLPAALNDLECGINLLTSLPTLPPSIKHLGCTYNHLNTLPALPIHLQDVYADHNRLTSLPLFDDSLYFLHLESNPLLSCLPPVRSHLLLSLYIDSTNIHCVPNRFTVSYYDIDPATLPLCGITSGCDFYYNLSGNVHNYASANCLQDSLHPGTAMRHMKVQLSQNNQVIQQCLTSQYGEYSFKTDLNTAYELTIDTFRLPLDVICPIGGVRPEYLTAADSVHSHEGFGVQCSSGDYGVTSISRGGRFRAGENTTIHISAGNLTQQYYGASCSSAMAGTITTTLSGPATYVGPAPGALTPASSSAHTLSYSIADIDSLQEGSLDIIVISDSTATQDSTLCISTTVTPSAADPYPTNDVLTQCFLFQNSWDPNHKEVYPTTLTPDGGWLTYTVHFQNTGNDTAYLVVLRDTLSQYVDASSFQYLASSHRAVIQLFGSTMVFTFPKINLVDSATNPPLSEGWIQYKVKAKANLPLQTQVKNTAYIYFDNNPAVVTNTTVNTVDTLTGVGITPVTASSTMHLYPNPNNGTFTLQTLNRIHTDYAITDMLGAVIDQRAITADRQQIDLHTAPAGVYTIVVKGAQPLRFVVVK